ncbi:MAG: ribosome maturation factor RimP [Alphaproteobacteria bacterium]|jgi:ribosome maturation factor RimP|nr:ribosome maturation factor RimP [Alphaproteobacteria bacterium]
MNTLEQKIFELGNPVASNLGYVIVDVKVFGKEKIILQIFLEKEDLTSVSIDDCAKFSREFAVLMDVNNLIEQRYILEVSSAGIDRKLAKLSDFQRFVGSNVAIKTKLPINGQKAFKGKLNKIVDTSLEILTEQGSIDIHIDFIDKANLDILKDLFKNPDSDKKNNKTKHKKGKKEEKNAK